MDDAQKDPLVMTVSHRKRMVVNGVQNRRLAPPTAKFLEWKGGDLKGTTMQPQSMFIWEGLSLIGCPRGSGANLVVQGVLYRILEIAEDAVKLEMHEEYRRDRPDETPTIPLDQICSQLRLCHAMCYYTSQGRTVRDRHVVLLDTCHPRFSIRALIVGMSRATHGDFVHIGDGDSNRLYTGDTTASGVKRTR